MNDIHDFFRNAKDRKLCERGARIWEHCKSNKQLIDYALSAWGCDYVCEAVCEGWGISPEKIAEDFAPFNNGRYIRNKDGYTSVMYCLPDIQTISISTTLTLIIGLRDGHIVVPKNMVGEIYLCDSEVTVGGEGKSVINVYKSIVHKKDSADADITVKM